MTSFRLTSNSLKRFQISGTWHTTSVLLLQCRIARDR